LKIDREKWESRYRQGLEETSGPDLLLEDHRDLLTSGTALDVASGYGAGSIFAARAGYVVHAVDISFTALCALNREAQRQNLPIRCVVTDLDYFPFPKNFYDLVMVFYFFSVPLMTSIGECLKRGGLIFYATFNHRHTSVRPEFNPAYLVPRGGLATYFRQFEVLLDEPEGGPDKNISRLIARKGHDKAR
jgi:SAM-dependent methyltransferase